MTYRMLTFYITCAYIYIMRTKLSYHHIDTRNPFLTYIRIYTETDFLIDYTVINILKIMYG